MTKLGGSDTTRKQLTEIGSTDTYRWASRRHVIVFTPIYCTYNTLPGCSVQSNQIFFSSSLKSRSFDDDEGVLATRLQYVNTISHQLETREENRYIQYAIISRVDCGACSRVRCTEFSIHDGAVRRKCVWEDMEVFVYTFLIWEFRAYDRNKVVYSRLCRRSATFATIFLQGRALLPLYQNSWCAKMSVVVVIIFELW